MFSYLHHIGDFNKATRHLTRIERSIYRDLLELYYETEKPISLDVGRVCRLIIARTGEEIAAVQQVLDEFFHKTDAGYAQVRCELEIEKYHGFVGQKSLAGKASAAKRAAKKQQIINGCSSNDETPDEEISTGELPFDEQPNSGEVTNHKPSTINHKPITDNQKDTSAQAPTNYVQEIFDHWKVRMNHPKAKMDDKRKKKIVAALKLYSYEDLLKAIDGCAKDPFSMGQNDRSTVYDDIDLIFRDAAHIDKFLKYNANPPSSSSEGKPKRFTPQAFHARQAAKQLQQVSPDGGVIEGEFSKGSPDVYSEYEALNHEQ